MLRLNLNQSRIKTNNPKRPTLKSSPIFCGENVREYLDHSSLHGMKYIADNNITFFER